MLKQRWKYQLLSSHCYHSVFLWCFNNIFITASTWHNAAPCKGLESRDSPLAPASMLCTQSSTGYKNCTALVHSSHCSKLHLLSKLSFGMSLASSFSVCLSLDGAKGQIVPEPCTCSQQSRGRMRELRQLSAFRPLLCTGNNQNFLNGH